ncbi:30S ribosomal protein S17 [bacterium]|nr:30S ribosomal protein S17 [bacterium]
MAEDVKTAEVAKKKNTQSVRGVVTSDKMDKTRIIEVKRSLRHGLYQKGLTRKTSFFIHDEKNESKTGDLVVAVATRRLSKNKSFRLLKILEKGA